jgi:alkylation response protein AidB-like acyl-CoA dehydrogenase
VGPTLAEHAEKHDREGTWVSESFDALREAGLLSIAVPAELGGAGASVRQVAMVQRELAKHCGSTALATAMHQHVTAFTAWRWKRGLPGAEATLKRVAEEGIVLISTGGADFTHPRGKAEKVDGGYRVSGTKIFASQSPAGTVLSTMFPFEDPERGMRVLNMAVPVASEGVSLIESWDAMGMRGTASNDVILEDVFVPDERILADRPYGMVDAPLQMISTIGFSVISGVYLGIAEGAVENAIAVAKDASSPTTQRQIGLMRHRVRVAAWALDGAFATIGEDPVPSLDTVEAVMIAKREIALAGVEITDLAMEVAGGAGFFRGSPIERAYRDIRAAKFHPFTPEATLLRAGRAALGLDVETP